jgi:hypothetical protein
MRVGVSQRRVRRRGERGTASASVLARNICVDIPKRPFSTHPFQRLSPLRSSHLLRKTVGYDHDEDDLATGLIAPA